MRKSLLVITSLMIIASFGFGVTVVSVVGSSAENDAGLAIVPISLTNTAAVGGLQFSLKDIPNNLSVHSVIPAGRTSADTFTDVDGSGDWTPGDILITDHNGNGDYDGPFDIQFNDRDSTVSILIYDGSSNIIIPGQGEICKIRYTKPANITDQIIELKFHEILNSDPQYPLVVSDPEGTALNTNWLNGLLTIGGIEVRFSGGGGTPGFISAPLLVAMNNAVPVKGIQFNIVDANNHLTIESVHGVNRGADFTFVGNEVSGQSMILGVNFNGQEIPPGSGTVLEISFMIAANAPTNSDISISISDLIVAAEGGLPLPSNGQDYVFPVTVGVEDETEIPTAFELKQNYPNPFNPTTTISYSVPEASEVVVGIYNLLGQEVRSLAYGDHQPGVYTTMWDGLNKNGVRVESGIYLYRMSSSAGFNATKKLVMLK